MWLRYIYNYKSFPVSQLFHEPRTRVTFLERRNKGFKQFLPGHTDEPSYSPRSHLKGLNANDTIDGIGNIHGILVY